MDINLSTISPAGLVALIIICLTIAGLIIFMFHAARSIKLTTKNVSLELSEKATKIDKSLENVKITETTSTRDVINRQNRIARSHIDVFSGELRKRIFQHYELGEVERRAVQVLVNLFTAELRFLVLNNLTENHIGTTEAQISEYTIVRAREYMAFTKAFFDDYDWIVPQYDLKVIIEELPDGYFYDKLFTIYNDCKKIEKHIKGGV